MDWWQWIGSNGLVAMDWQQWIGSSEKDTNYKLYNTENYVQF
jgi:hypothetical protein